MTISPTICSATVILLRKQGESGSPTHLPVNNSALSMRRELARDKPITCAALFRLPWAYRTTRSKICRCPSARPPRMA
jgi:hypothetical protein